MRQFFLSCFVIFWALSTLAWGERGHNVIGQVAAKLVRANDKKVGPFFHDRAIAFGHLANIPDISWRRPLRQAVAKAEGPTHFIDPEVLLGVPGDSLDAYAKRIRELSTDYAALKKNYDGQINNLPEKKAKNSRLFVFRDFGGSPWRAQQFFDLAIAAFQCAKNKEAVNDEKIKKAVNENFIHNEFNVHETIEFKCVKDEPRKKDLYQAWMFLGVMSHYVGDQSQPMHATANYDGWYSGHGGLHAYFETDIVRELDESLQGDVLKKARSAEFQKKVWSDVKVDWSKKDAVTQLVLNMAANSYRRLHELEKLDDQFAITKKGSTQGWGDDNRAARKAPVRKPASSVTANFRAFIVDRLAFGSYVLSEIWPQAWRQGGEPNLSDLTAYALPYPLDVPYVWPSFETRDKTTAD